VNGILYVDRIDTKTDLFKLDSTDWATARPLEEPEAEADEVVVTEATSNG
jgi:hypothetical protein